MEKLIQKTKSAILDCVFMKDYESHITLTECYKELLKIEGDDKLYKKIHQEMVNEYIYNK